MTILQVCVHSLEMSQLAENTASAVLPHSGLGKRFFHMYARNQSLLQ